MVGYLKQHDMAVFGIAFSTHSVVPWVVSIGVAVGGVWLAKRFAPEMKQAYEQASTLEGGS